IGAGQLMDGFSTSLTVTVKVHIGIESGGEGTDTLVAVEVTPVVPTTNVEPDGGFESAVTSGHRPSTFGANVTMALHWPGALSTVIGAGHSMVGSGSWKDGCRSRCAVSPPAMTLLLVARYSKRP